jgi:hypothetical protein
MANSPDVDMARKIQLIARLKHNDWRRHADDTPRAEPNTIARVAAKISRRYYRTRFTAEAATKEILAACAGNLVYAMELYGLSWEGVCDLSDNRVAAIVAGLSPDITRPHGLRQQQVCSKLVEATLDTQMVRLSELYCTAKTVRDTATDDDLLDQRDALRRWADDAEATHASLTKLRMPQSRCLGGVMAQTRELILWVGKAGDGLPPPVLAGEAQANPEPRSQACIPELLTI